MLSVEGLAIGPGRLARVKPVRSASRKWRLGCSGCRPGNWALEHGWNEEFQTLNSGFHLSATLCLLDHICLCDSDFTPFTGTSLYGG